MFVAQFVSAAEESRQDQFQDAVLSYSQGDYQTAIKSFESLLKDEISAPLFYNLANSYAQSSQSGRAILNYERALRLNPSDSDIRGNLELLRRDQGLFQEEQSITQRFVSFLGLNQ
ncbi:MAG: tetratricopeptide repeat protein, partial [Desulfocapsa sp.]|nr:tetratricopeptide repeat protein [Desulfocapsa sp.]